MRIISPAKINLHLRVGPLASDGFHPILSWMCATGLHDIIELRDRKQPGITLTCDRPDVPVDESNLIARAAKALAPHRGANVSLKKKIPIGGGLGGGSSNAASALMGFNKLWKLNLPRNRLAQIAATLGSDVPFFLSGPSSICQGRGEKITPIPPPLPKHVVLIFPKLSISTPAVYRKFDEMKRGSTEAIKNHHDIEKWTTYPAEQLLPMLANDLEAPTFSLSPELATLRTKLEKSLHKTIRMSGSGSTFFTLADDAAAANKIIAGIHAHGVAAESYSLG